MSLYADDNARVVDGDVDSVEYWRARARCAQLAAAAGQPWNALARWRPGALAVLDEALALYPNHRRLRTCRGEIEAIPAEIDPAYDTSWARGFPWAQRPFIDGWIALHRARHGRSVHPPAWHLVHVEARKVAPAWDACWNLHDWPEEARAFVAAGRAEAGRLEIEARAEVG